MIIIPIDPFETASGAKAVDPLSPTLFFNLNINTPTYNGNQTAPVCYTG